MRFPRRSGVLIHPTSLPGRFGIGDFGDEAYDFVDFLAAAGQSYWQILPLSPTGYGDSPYQGLSAFAGNPMLISPKKLVEQGHLSEADLAEIPHFPDDKVDFGPVIYHKTRLLDRAYANFTHAAAGKPADARQHVAFALFCQEHASWLDDFALFMALKEAHNLRPWSEWDWPLQSRDPEALAHWQGKLAGEIESQKYRQWQFFEQWLALKTYANERGIRIVGDIPIFVAQDSADVWANTELFTFDKNLRQTVQSGVPPDYFSETGQLWGHPLYRWDVMAEDGYAWWIDRFRMALTQADTVRIDHFRAFHNYWEVPASAKTAIKGRWRYGPGADIFRSVTVALGPISVIAEDLGDFDKESRAGVNALQAEFGYPGMKVVQFSFGAGPADPFLPHNFCRNWIVYTGTHDNDTVQGWYEETSTEEERDYARKYLGRDGLEIAWDLIRLGWASTAHTAMTTVQDLLGLGHDSRMNTPSTVGPPNWCWRLLPKTLGDELTQQLMELTTVYGRLADKADEETVNKPADAG